MTKIAAVTAALSLGITTAGCGAKEELKDAYDITTSSAEYGITTAGGGESVDFFASDLCIAGTNNISNEEVNDSLSEAAALFDVNDEEVLYNYNMYEQMYPASTTKILTAYLALKYGNLDDEVTVSANALQLESGASTCGIEAGDVLTLEDLLYGLMLPSGNDAAIAIAEHLSGSVEEFSALMNKEAKALGATHSNFLNPNGLHDENHYTTVYDLYLIFNAAIQEKEFLKIINSTSYEASFTNALGETKEESWTNSNLYLKEEKEAPDGITVVGGKTGTTNSARYCLVLLSEDTSGNPYVSIVLKADSRDNLYYHMTELLQAATGK